VYSFVLTPPALVPTLLHASGTAPRANGPELVRHRPRAARPGGHGRHGRAWVRCKIPDPPNPGAGAAVSGTLR
jgi:hypothetical protein